MKIGTREKFKRTRIQKNVSQKNVSQNCLSPNHLLSSAFEWNPLCPLPKTPLKDSQNDINNTPNNRKSRVKERSFRRTPGHHIPPPPPPPPPKTSPQIHYHDRINYSSNSIFTTPSRYILSPKQSSNRSSTRRRYQPPPPDFVDVDKDKENSLTTDKPTSPPLIPRSKFPSDFSLLSKSKSNRMNPLDTLILLDSNNYSHSNFSNLCLHNHFDNNKKIRKPPPPTEPYNDNFDDDSKIRLRPYNDNFDDDSKIRLRRSWVKQQIAIGKSTIEYKKYLQYIPKDKRLNHHPTTPEPDNIGMLRSKRSWGGILRQWRRALHIWGDSNINIIN